MTTAAAQSPPVSAPAKAKGQRLISLENFFARYTSRDDPFKYEWNNGLIEKKPRTMNRDQMKLLQKLMRLFTRTMAYMDMGELISEVDMFMKNANRTRRADIAYLTGKQIQESSKGDLSICPFVVEVISKNDQVNEVDEKLVEYFENGVQVVWTIFPKLKKVEIHRSLKDVTICFGDDVCSAAPILPDFEISVNDLFA